jgi:hypothetical protein
MASADNGDLLREVLMMGSVSWLPSRLSTTASEWRGLTFVSTLPLTGDNGNEVSDDDFPVNVLLRACCNQEGCKPVPNRYILSKTGRYDHDDDRLGS